MAGSEGWFLCQDTMSIGPMPVGSSLVARRNTTEVLTLAAPFCQDVGPRPACPAGSIHAGGWKSPVRKSSASATKRARRLQPRTCGSPHILNLLSTTLPAGHCLCPRPKSLRALHNPNQDALQSSRLPGLFSPGQHQARLSGDWQQSRPRPLPLAFRASGAETVPRNRGHHIPCCPRRAEGHGCR